MLDSDDAVLLLQAVTQPAALGAQLADRRQSLLLAIAEAVAADAGHWAWGRGNPLDGPLAPIAMIDFGYTDQQRAIMIEHALSPEANAQWQARVMPLVQQRGHLGMTRRDLFADDFWASSELWSGYVARVGLDSFAHAVRYADADTWSCLHCMRATGREEFTRREADLLDTALVGISWLNAQAEEVVPAEEFAGLTPRQRTIALMLLDGLTRKKAAASLGISEETVNHHVKAIFRHFKVQSATELAALFLRSQ